MRKAIYDMRRVICPNSSCLGHSSNVAKPGYWITWNENARRRVGRVLGRIKETDTQGENCAGFLAVMGLSENCANAGIAWVNPAHVSDCYKKAPADLLAWITGAEWVKSKRDIARLIAMQAHGTTSESFIATRNDPEKAYNARPEYVAQFILGGAQ